MAEKNRISASVSEACVLLGGQPRSGTTLLSSILRSGRDHFQGFELHIRKPSFVVGLEGRYTRNIFAQLGMEPAAYDRILAEFDLEAMNLGSWVGPKEKVSAELPSGKETDSFATEMRARCALVDRLMHEVARGHGAKTWGFKILGDIIYADQYRAAWPDARFIFMIRDPRDHALSVLKLNEQRAQRSQQMFFADYADVARGWVETLVLGRAVLAEHRIPYIEVKYEELTRDPETEVKRLEDFTGSDLSGGLSYYQSDYIKTQTARFKHHDNLTRPINTDSVGKWRHVLSDAENAVFIEIAGQAMRDLGYL